MIRWTWRVDESRHHHAAARVDDLGVRRDRHLGGGADLHDPVAFDHDGRVVQRRDLVSVEQHAADECQLLPGLRAEHRAASEQQKRPHQQVPNGMRSHLFLSELAE
jgi:hypothetical protein